MNLKIICRILKPAALITSLMFYPVVSIHAYRQDRSFGGGYDRGPSGSYSVDQFREQMSRQSRMQVEIANINSEIRQIETRISMPTYLNNPVITFPRTDLDASFSFKLTSFYDHLKQNSLNQPQNNQNLPAQQISVDINREAEQSQMQMQVTEKQKELISTVTKIEDRQYAMNTVNHPLQAESNLNHFSELPQTANPSDPLTKLEQIQSMSRTVPAEAGIREQTHIGPLAIPPLRGLGVLNPAEWMSVDEFKSAASPLLRNLQPKDQLPKQPDTFEVYTLQDRSQLPEQMQQEWKSGEFVYDEDKFHLLGIGIKVSDDYGPYESQANVKPADSNPQAQMGSAKVEQKILVVCPVNYCYIGRVDFGAPARREE